MKKLIQRFSQAFEQENETQIAINGIMKTLFQTNTLDAIILKQKLDDAFEKELKERNLNALTENADVENYFRTKLEKAKQEM